MTFCSYSMKTFLELVTEDIFRVEFPAERKYLFPHVHVLVRLRKYLTAQKNKRYNNSNTSEE